MSISPPRDEDPVRVGPFRVVGRVGVGGMGQVFVGRDGGRRTVALKVIRPDLAGEPGFRERFAREVAVARRARGRFIARLVAADTDGTPAWSATRYLPGPTLAEAVESYGPLPVGTVLPLAAGLAAALTDLHAAGIVHRDLKPGNVILLDDGPRVIDFGISRTSDMSAVTRAGELVGSPGFLAPEGVAGGDVGPAGDVFALGALLCFAATGTGPFGRGQSPTLMYRVVHEQPDLDGVPATIRDLVADCLAKQPEDRPTIGDLRTRLLAMAPAGRPDGGWLPHAVVAEIADRRRDLKRLAVPASVAATEIRRRPHAAAARQATPRSDTAGRRRTLWSAVAAVGAAVVVTVAAIGYLSLPDAEASRAGDAPAPGTPRTTGAPVSAPSVDSRTRQTPYAYPTSALTLCLRTAVRGGFDLAAGRPVAGGPIFTSAPCDRIHVKLTGAVYETHARACVQSSDGTFITGCSEWILLPYPDTWGTLPIPVKDQTRWQLEMRSVGTQSVRFLYTM
jgi:hypothetical protein